MIINQIHENKIDEMKQTTIHLNPSSTFPFLRSTGMTARHSNPKSKKKKKKFLFDPFLFIHVWTTWMLSVKNSLIGTRERASAREKKFNIQKHLSFPSVLGKCPPPFFWFLYSRWWVNLKCTEKPRPKTTPFGAYQRNKRWRRKEKGRGWWSCVIEPRDEFDGDGSIQSLNKKMGAKKGRNKK